MNKFRKAFRSINTDEVKHSERVLKFEKKYGRNPLLLLKELVDTTDLSGYKQIKNLTIEEIVNKCKSCDDCSKCEIKELCNIEFYSLTKKILNKKVEVLKK